MKNILVFLLVCLSANTQCMEQPTPLQQEIAENELGSFSNFPEALIEYLFYFIPEASSMKEIFKKLAQLSLVNSKFKEIAESKVLLKELGKRYIKFHRLEAEKQFLDASDQILQGNRTKEYDTIIATLLPGINFTLKNKILIDASSTKKGNIEIVKLVLNSGPIDDFYANAALWYASKKGTVEIVKLVLDNGANANAVNINRRTALMIASKRGHLEIVKLLLDHGADVNNTTGNNDNTALMIASQRGHKEVVKLLLYSGANVRAINRWGNTPLMAAAYWGHQEIVKFLLDSGADVNVVNNYGYTALTYASKNGYQRIIKLLLDFGADGHAPIRKLIKAALLGKKEKGKRVLEKWVGIDNNDSIFSNFIKDKIPLISIPEAKSVHNIYKQLRKLLQVDQRLEAVIKDKAFVADLARGYCKLYSQQAESELAEIIERISCNAIRAKEEKNSKRFARAKTLAQRFDYLEEDLYVQSNNIATEQNLNDLLIDKACFLAYGLPFFNKYSYFIGAALVHAVHNNRLVKLLLVNGANVNGRDRDGYRALMEASKWNLTEIIELLINAGADVNAEDSNGKTALIYAAEHGHKEAARLLLDSGANVNDASDIEGNAALMEASKWNLTEIIELLLDNGANVNAKSTNGDTALMRASGHGHQDIVKLLINAGADVNAADISGNTPLMCASFNGHNEIVELLLSKQANVNAYNSNYCSALMLAANGGHKKIVQLLLDRHADISIKNIQGNTALILNLISLYEGHWRIGDDDITEIASLLLDNGYRPQNLNVNAANHDGETALMWAARLNCIELIFLLIDRGGADADAENNIGETALMIALKLGNTKAADFLKGYSSKDSPVDYPAKSSGCCLQ